MENQYDVYGNLFGLLAAHPVTPLVSLHHLDVVEPIFPNMTQVQALQHLTIPMKLDSAGLMQQSVCYHKPKKWTISVSWGFAVQIIRGVLSPREMEMPTRTFLNWYRRADYTAYAFNTRPVARNPCQKPYVYYLSKAKFDKEKNQTVSEYLLHRVQHPLCRWRMIEPSTIDRVVVYKKPDPQLWSRVSSISIVLLLYFFVLIDDLFYVLGNIFNIFRFLLDLVIKLAAIFKLVWPNTDYWRTVVSLHVPYHFEVHISKSLVLCIVT